MAVTFNSNKSPSVLGLYFCAFLMAVIGLLLGFVYMSCFPLQAFNSEAEYEAEHKAKLAELAEELAEGEEPVSDPLPGDAYYIQGLVAQERFWKSKRDLLAAEGARVVKFSAAELNAWFESSFQPGAVDRADAENGILLVPDSPNVGLSESGWVYLNLPLRFITYGSERDLVLSARGILIKDGFQIDTVHLSGAKLPFANYLGLELFKLVEASFRESVDWQILSDAYARAESVDVVDGEFVFNLR
jgi:hypothetical protein